MQQNRLYLTFDEAEVRELARQARRDFRSIRDQARYLILKELDIIDHEPSRAEPARPLTAVTMAAMEAKGIQT